MSTAATETSPPPSKPAALNRYPWYAPRFWHGMRTRDYFGMFWRNRFKIHPARWHVALAIAPVSVINSALYRLQNLIYGRRIRDVELTHPPIFIVGHWRSGTTHLHELLVRDERFTFPTTFECFAPNDFLVADSWAPYLFYLFLPRKRPMDNMAMGLAHPQEDEFALCGMGAPTPYMRMAFPNHPPPFQEMFNTDAASQHDVARFREALDRFVRCITVRRNKTIVLKSPPHTGRVGLLAEMYPGARFIHISRDPYALFPSTQRLWRALDAAQGFQLPRHEHLDDYIFDCFERMYAGFEHQRQRIPPEQISDVRYEDLIADPIGQVRRLYDELDLGDFDTVQPALEAYLSTQKDYKPNRHELPAALKAEIDRRWAGYKEKYGYA